MNEGYTNASQRPDFAYNSIAKIKDLRHEIILDKT